MVSAQCYLKKKVNSEIHLAIRVLEEGCGPVSFSLLAISPELSLHTNTLSLRETDFGKLPILLLQYSPFKVHELSTLGFLVLLLASVGKRLSPCKQCTWAQRFWYGKQILANLIICITIKMKLFKKNFFSVIVAEATHGFKNISTSAPHACTLEYWTT